MNAIQIKNVSHRYGNNAALEDVTLSIPSGATVGLIGPDGVGKSTLLSLIAGVKIIQSGSVQVLGSDMADKRARQALSSRIAFMPQGLGHNLYPTLSVYENIDFHARLFGLGAHEREQRIQRLLDATGLAPFPERPAGKLSGGMKQKLSLCCALVHNPDLLILDEPTTGVDPLSRRQFWSLVDTLQSETSGMTVIVATAYIEEAERFEHLLAMDAGKLLVNKPTQQVMQESSSTTLEEAYIKLLPEEKRQGSGGLEITPFISDPNSPPAIEADHLTKRFGDFTAVDNVSFTIPRGEIFGFLGSNGCGKSTTMKMLTGLLDVTKGSAKLLGKTIDTHDMSTRMRVGYMSQAFSLYEELSVRQNLELHARLYQMENEAGSQAVKEALVQFDLTDVADSAPTELSLGIRQRLQLAAACLHHPEVLILDEPTSGVDPAARDMFWRHLLKLSREDKITIFVSTHFMNEAARCDRISFMHRGRVLGVGTPEQLQQEKNAPSLEAAFIKYLEEDQGDEAFEGETLKPTSPALATHVAMNDSASEAVVKTLDLQAEKLKSSVPQGLRYWFAMVWTFALREGKELLRDRIRLFFSIGGPILLLITTVYSISFDINHLKFAVLDRDQTVESRHLVEYFSGSKYLVREADLHSEQDIDETLKSSRARLVIDIPPGFGTQLLRMERPEVGFFIDGSMTFTAENVKNFVGGIVLLYTQDVYRSTGLPIDIRPAASIEPRFMYNQDFSSIYAIAPAIIMLVLILIPTMTTALGVVREKEIGSITNLYASPATVSQYLVGKQMPYVALGMLSYFVLVLLSVFWLHVPIKGSLMAMTLGAFLLVFAATALGLMVSSFVKTQVASMFACAVIALIPGINFSGLMYPMSTLTGMGYWLGWGFPASWYQLISIGGFTKGLGFSDMLQMYGMLILFYLVYLLVACVTLKKQEV